jgi:hypothetical protein
LALAANGVPGVSSGGDDTTTIGMDAVAQQYSGEGYMHEDADEADNPAGDVDEEEADDASAAQYGGDDQEDVNDDVNDSTSVDTDDESLDDDVSMGGPGHEAVAPAAPAPHVDDDHSGAGTGEMGHDREEGDHHSGSGHDSDHDGQEDDHS